MLVWLSRRESNADRSESDSRVPVSRSVGRVFPLFALFGLACSGDAPSLSGDVLTLDSRSGSARINIDPGEEPREFLVFPFSAATDNITGRGTYQLSLKGEGSGEAEASIPLPATRVLRQLEDVSSAPPGTDRLIQRLAAETERTRTQTESLHHALSALETDPTPFHRFYQSRTGARAQIAPDPNFPETIEIYSPFDGEEGTRVSAQFLGRSANLLHLELACHQVAYEISQIQNNPHAKQHLAAVADCVDELKHFPSTPRTNFHIIR